MSLLSSWWFEAVLRHERAIFSLLTPYVCVHVNERKALLSTNSERGFTTTSTTIATNTAHVYVCVPEPAKAPFVWNSPSSCTAFRRQEEHTPERSMNRSPEDSFDQATADRDAERLRIDALERTMSFSSLLAVFEHPLSANLKAETGESTSGVGGGIVVTGVSGTTSLLAKKLARKTELEIVKESPTKPIPPIEVDFYRNPTILSRLILNQKYEAAIRRLHKNPEEAHVWVCAKRKPSKGDIPNSQIPFSLRQLPVHIAICNLQRCRGQACRDILNLLITNLVVVNPDSCRFVDHLGKLPLHLAIADGATPETISVMLMAHPASTESRDKQGRTMIALNQNRSLDDGRDQVHQVLSLGVDFWNEAHQEAVLRLKHAAPSLPSKDDKSVDSVSVMASSKAEEETLLSSVEQNRDPEPLPLLRQEGVEAIAWEQLEERAIALEEILAEVNERNYALNIRLDAVAKSKKELLDKLDEVHGDELVSDISQLEKQNLELQAKVIKMERLIRSSVIRQDLGGDGRKRRRQHEPNRSFHPLLDGAQKGDLASDDLALQNRRLLQAYEDLNAMYDKQQERLDRLEVIIETLTSEADEDYDDYSYHPSSNSVWSDLSAPSERILLERQAMRNVVQSHPAFDITWVPPQILVAESDDLSVIFQEAAIQESLLLARRDNRNRPQAWAPKFSTTNMTAATKSFRSNRDSIDQKQMKDLEIPVLHDSPHSSMSDSKRSDNARLKRAGFDTKISRSRGRSPRRAQELAVGEEAFANASVAQDSIGYDSSIYGSSMHLSMHESIYSEAGDMNELEIPALNTSTSNSVYEPIDRINLSRIGLFEDDDSEIVEVSP